MNTESGIVKIISKEMIKPSSPTPRTLRNLKLSFLDQLIPPFYVPVIFFYTPDHHQQNPHHHRNQISQQLKRSLSESLTLFYPLAGRLNSDDLSINCNDAGAEFTVALVHSSLSAAVEDPIMEELEKYLPTDPKTLISSAAAPPPPLLAVQVNFFDCGGIAIGVCSSHQVADAASLVAFLSSWAALNRGEKHLSPPPPSFDLARNFPARDVSAAGFSTSVYRKKETLVTKRFIFDKEKLAALKKLAATSSPPPETITVGDPTRVEVVSAFIWKHFIDMAKSENSSTVSALWHVVNLRPRIKTSQILNDVVGNCILKKFFLPDDGDQNEFHDLVRKLRNGIREINEDYIWELAEKGDDIICNKNNYLDEISKWFERVVSGEMEACGFSSWCRFPVYDVDYGWGSPVWVCPTSCPEKNVTFLMSTKDGDGVEAWMNILESTVEILENKFKLIGTN